MYTSLARLKELPPQTKVYCAHEYTSDNALFLKNLGNLNFDQKLFLDEVSLKRAQKSPTVPTYLADELKCNPFLLAKSAEEFAKIRILKDNFKAV
jgi:hydroxyacylglutathione hydrolase